MHQSRSYLLALEEEPYVLDGMYLGVDARGYNVSKPSVTSTLFGGRGPRTGENSVGRAVRQASQRRRKNTFPAAGM
jgi:hypothetical protein